MDLMITKNPEIIQHLLMEDDRYPNNAALPLLIYKHAFTLPVEGAAREIEKRFEQNDWSNTWIDDIFPYHHYHGNTHEVLAVISGHCIVQFGGDHGVTEELRIGDVVIIPAGVAHKKIAGENFKCLGAYPHGKDYNIRFGASGEKEESRRQIEKVPVPEKDPMFGNSAGIKSYWNKRREYAQ